MTRSSGRPPVRVSFMIMPALLLAPLLSSGVAAQEPDRIAGPAEAALFDAIRSADIAAVERLVKDGTDPNAVEGHSTPLGSALRTLFSEDQADDIAEVVRLLLAAGADPNARYGLPGDEISPVEGALFRSLEVMRLLLDAGADPNVFRCDTSRDIPGGLSSPLGHAEWAGDEAADLLRAAGAHDPSTSGAEFAVLQNAADAPLHVAVWRGESAAVDRLLEAGSDPNALLTGRTLVTGEVERFTPLALALRPDREEVFNEEIVRLLLAAGADPNERFELVCTVEKVTPLLIASARGEVNVVRLLLEAGADPNVAVEVEDFGNGDLYVLHSRGYSGEPLRMGASYTPLRVAMEGGYSDVTAILREAGGQAPAGTEDMAPLREFEENFASCTPGAPFTSSVEALGTIVRYDILGPREDGCRISMTYESNPNPEWVNKPLLVTLYPRDRFARQLRIIELCLSGRDMNVYGPLFSVDPDCGGPLLELIER